MKFSHRLTNMQSFLVIMQELLNAPQKPKQLTFFHLKRAYQHQTTRRANAAGLMAVPGNMGQLLFNFFSKIKLLVVLLGPVSVEELVCVEHAHFNCFARYARKNYTLTCFWF